MDLVEQDRTTFNQVIQVFKAEVFTGAAFVTVDMSVRVQYSRQIELMSQELSQQVVSCQITWAQAAKEAQAVRNDMMQIMRNRSTPVGRALAQSIKLSGKSFNSLIEEKTAKIFGLDANFQRLSSVQRNLIYAEIVQSAGRSNIYVNNMMRRFTRAGRAIVVLSVACSVYEIAVAENKTAVLKREIATTGAGVGGSMLGGAAAGLACGPGAPMCVAIGAFVSGALCAWGVSIFF